MKDLRFTAQRVWRNKRLWQTIRNVARSPRDMLLLLVLGPNDLWRLKLGRQLMDDLTAFRTGTGDNPAQEGAAVIDAFHTLYFNRWPQTLENTRWMGLSVLKCPLDLWVYQEIIHETDPDFIIETGTYRGGSAMYFAGLCDLRNKGHVITIDAAEYVTLDHPRITQIVGNSVDDETVGRVREIVGEMSALVSLDSDHERDHVLREMRAYSELVPVGGYMVVEDTDLNGHPLPPAGEAPGPYEAVEQFVRENPSFEADVSREKYMLTFNPTGWLRRIE